MPYHTLNGPLFHWSDFLWSFVDYILGHPLAFASVLVTAFLILFLLCEAIATEAAKRKVARDAAITRESLERARMEFATRLADLRNKKGA